MSVDDRDSVDNLILLCPNHHTEVDAAPVTYPVEFLRRMKREHEQAVMSAEAPADAKRRLAEETYAEYIDEWAGKADLEHWELWSTSLVRTAQPSLAQERYQTLEELRHWLLGRIWSGIHPELDASLQNFRRVLDDLMVTFASAMEDDEAEVVRTHKFYKIPRWAPREYDQLLRAYKEHVALVVNLAYELTRAANLVCDRVRETLDPRFRVDEGALLIGTGLYSPFAYRTLRVEYSAPERDAPPPGPYPGIEAFGRIAKKRDYSVSPADF